MLYLSLLVTRKYHTCQKTRSKLRLKKLHFYDPILVCQSHRKPHLPIFLQQRLLQSHINSLSQRLSNRKTLLLDWGLYRYQSRHSWGIQLTRLLSSKPLRIPTDIALVWCTLTTLSLASKDSARISIPGQGSGIVLHYLSSYKYRFDDDRWSRD